MNGLEQWIEGKARAAAYQISLGNLKKAQEAVKAMSQYSVDTNEIAALRTETMEKLGGQLKVDKEVVLLTLEPLIEAIKGAKVTSEAKALKLGGPADT